MRRDNCTIMWWNIREKVCVLVWERVLARKGQGNQVLV